MCVECDAHACVQAAHFHSKAVSNVIKESNTATTTQKRGLHAFLGGAVRECTGVSVVHGTCNTACAC